MAPENLTLRLETVSGERASDRIEGELTRMILSLELAPGSMQQESALITRLGCGRTPLREALQRLSRDGLLEILPRRGIYVTSLNINDYYETIEALAVVEPYIGRLAAERIDRPELADLEAILARFQQAVDDPVTLLAVDLEFHHAIARASRNRYLLDTDLRLHRFTQRYSIISWQSRDRAFVALEAHRQITAALAAGAAEQTERLIQAHIATSKNFTMQGFEDYRHNMARSKPVL